jgi:hypothetical protein
MGSPTLTASTALQPDLDLLASLTTCAFAGTCADNDALSQEAHLRVHAVAAFARALVALTAAAAAAAAAAAWSS